MLQFDWCKQKTVSSGVEFNSTVRLFALTAGMSGNQPLCAAICFSYEHLKVSFRFVHYVRRTYARKVALMHISKLKLSRICQFGIC